MADESHLDDKYFVDDTKYNCPYCKRGHVSYAVETVQKFNWDDSKDAWAIFVKCGSCGRLSLHLSFKGIAKYIRNPHGSNRLGFVRKDDIDDALVHSIPSSFHTIDERIPRKIREPLAEAEGCLRSNFLTGASACARKVVFELAADQNAEGDDYETRIKSLKVKLPQVDPTYFDTLVTVHEMTSSKVHEDAYDGWESKHLRVILGALREVLREVYVVPEERKTKRQALLELKQRLLSGKDDAASAAADEAEDEELGEEA